MLRKLQDVTAGRAVAARRQEDWKQVSTHIHKLLSVDWMQPRIKGDEASRRPAAGGYPESWHLLDNGAIALVTGGSGSHTDDYGVAAVRVFALTWIRRH